MKARVKATGEVFNILEINIPMGRVSVYLTEDTARDYRLGEVEVLTNGVEGQNLTTDIDWEQRRYEIAKTMLSTMNHATIREDVEASINYADELINQLKQNNYEQD